MADLSKNFSNDYSSNSNDLRKIRTFSELKFHTSFTGDDSTLKNTLIKISFIRNKIKNNYKMELFNHKKKSFNV
ncbi:hypothetical protein BpHYR1_014387 [Brachionus plicatilis]|uniref:Uncharacterized protein n=1 Tax=Brachionus plicatilis TaxID=10195 RepID=A0A3M7RLE4_BRAPC|nr:hypothetical protein BpHYR1_014387 [Brachionus plicatilis]